MTSRWDVAVVGGGPAGLALASMAARRGLSSVVLERRRAPFDKACGEGVLPAGVRALEALGVREAIERAGCAAIEGVRYVDASERIAEGRLRARALGVRRTLLVDALRERAREDGAVLLDDAPVVRHVRGARHVTIETERGAHEASFLVAADGLGSRVRRAEGLDRPVRGPRRFGLRRHFRVRPWTSFVEVHLGPGCEAYVTPVAHDRVGVALLWDAARPSRGSDGRASFERMLRRFPRLERALEGASPEGRVLGAGPLARASSRRTRDRLALLGDAAGYVDAITGEGISLALGCAAALGAVLPDAIARDGSSDALAPYERAFADAFRTYAYATRSLLWLACRPRARRIAVDVLARAPRVFDAALDAVVG